MHGSIYVTIKGKRRWIVEYRLDKKKFLILQFRSDVAIEILVEYKPNAIYKYAWVNKTEEW